MPIPGKTFQTSYVLLTNKTVKQSNYKCRKLLSINLTHQTMNPSQNALQMSIVSLADTSRETATPLTDGYNNN